MIKVFISYASEDLLQAEKLYKQLQAMGVEPWLDKYKLFPGCDWNREITKAITDSDIMIVLLSNRMLTKRGYIQKELRESLDVAKTIPEEEIYLIPAKISECEIPTSLKSYQCVDLYKRDGIFDLFKTIHKVSNGKDLELFKFSTDMNQELIFNILRSLLYSSVKWNEVSLNEFVDKYFPIARLILLADLSFNNLIPEGIESEAEKVMRDEMDKASTLKISTPEQFLALFQKLAMLHQKTSEERALLMCKSLTNIRHAIEKVRAESKVEDYREEQFIRTCDDDKSIYEIVIEEYNKGFPLSGESLSTIESAKGKIDIKPYTYGPLEKKAHLELCYKNLNRDRMLRLFFENINEELKFNVVYDSKSFRIIDDKVECNLDKEDISLPLSELSSIGVMDIKEGNSISLVHFPSYFEPSSSKELERLHR
jgi:hypothetical protein